MPAPLKRWRPPRPRLRPACERAHYRTADWRARRVRILVRDSFTCRACGRMTSGQEAHVDHILPLEEGGTDADDNLQVLCKSCHGKKTRAEQRRRGHA